ncbi:MAG: NADPH-dependent 7-cyano-7-deazaguanine reductase QueF [Euryarchaeota archaeon]|nr:NADPH-dependent 7-cyano-7-deazaguanine reductase QueF [Euryarchaeota archaeon]
MASEYEGRQDYVRDIELPGIETVRNMYPDRDYTVEVEYPEFTTLCPKTGLPDFATVRISYVPDERIAELKSLKHYFIAYRDLGFFHENFTNRILDDFVRAVDPKEAHIEVRVNVRGGILTTVRRSYRRKGV